jgi:hypothetical protein
MEIGEGYLGQAMIYLDIETEVVYQMIYSSGDIVKKEGIKP